MVTTSSRKFSATCAANEAIVCSAAALLVKGPRLRVAGACKTVRKDGECLRRRVWKVDGSRHHGSGGRT